MLTLNRIWHGTVFGASMLLVASSFVLQYNSGQRTVAQTGGNTCGSDAYIVHPPNDQNFVAGGTLPVDVYVKPFINGQPVNPTKVSIFINGQFIKDLTRVSAASNEWQAELNTQNTSSVPNGLVQMYAKVHGGSSFTCQSQAISIQMTNDTSSGDNGPTVGDFILVRKDPLVSTWIGPTQLSKDFTVEGRFKPSGANTYGNGSSDTTFNWVLAPGSVGFLDGDLSSKKVRYFTAGSPGTAQLIVEATYNGTVRTKSYNITVESQSSTNYPAIDKDTAQEILNDTRADDSNQPTDVLRQIDSESLNEILTSDTELTACLESIVGEEAYQAIVDGSRRLTFKQLKLAERCYTSTRFLLPANVAPIDPLKIREVREDSGTASVSQAEQAANIGLDRDGIVFSGTASKDRSVVVYIFSEPLVLTTSSDENGNWTYVLEDPLEPGDHEVFVAVENDEGEVVRSSAFTFSVAQAASIESNPSGLSLTLDLSDPGQNSTIYYVSGVVAVMLVGLGLYVFMVRRKPQIIDESVVDEPPQEK